MLYSLLQIVIFNVFDIKEYVYLPLTLHVLGINTICVKH